MLEDFSETVRNLLPYFCIIFLLCSPALADKNFDIKRLMQYDIMGVTHGSRASAINMEVKSFASNYNTLRNVALANFQDLSIDQFRDIKTKFGALVILLPKSLNPMSNEEKEAVLALEQAMLAEETAIPVYFTKFNEEIFNIINEFPRHSEKSKANILNQINANGYQLMVSGASHAPRKDPKIPMILGELLPFKQTVPKEDGHGAQLPSIVITTQLKAFGITNDLPPNFDTTILLTLIEMFSKLYRMSSSAKYRIIFVLHESGYLLNFHALKALNFEELNIQNVEFALCLDTLSENIDSVIKMHVSKALGPTGSVSKFYEILEKTAQRHSKSTESVHKKISLASSSQKWAHEVFSMKRIPAFTLSAVSNYADPLRNSIFTEYSSNSPTLDSETDLDQSIHENIRANTKILAEALASFIFDLDEVENDEIFTGKMSITQQSIQPYLAPRLSSSSNNVKLTFEKFLQNVKIVHDKPDVRDQPEFMFYEGEEAKLNIYNVKPAVFDLFLTSLISCYLFGIYFIIIQFPKFYDVFGTSVPSTNGGIHHKTKTN